MTATLFVEIWKRRQSILAWEWDLEMDDQEEQPRPEFEVSSDNYFPNQGSSGSGNFRVSPFSALLESEPEVLWLVPQSS